MRYETINIIVNKNKAGIASHYYFEDSTLRIVMVDALIEKAQLKLTKRARSYRNSGICLYIFSFIVVIFSAFFVSLSDEIVTYIKSYYFYNNKAFANYYEHQVDFIKDEMYRFFLTLLKKTASGGVLIGFCYIIIATANSCFRESTILMHRRHSLRYIRLLSYQNGGKINPEDLKDVFGIGDVMNSGFDRVKTIAIKDNWIAAMFEAFKGIAGKDEKIKK